MACRPQSNPTFTSSDGVPPELAVLGFQRAPAYTGQTGLRYRSDRSAQGFAGVDRFDDRSRVLAHSSVLARFCVNSNSGIRFTVPRHAAAVVPSPEFIDILVFSFLCFVVVISSCVLFRRRSPRSRRPCPAHRLPVGGGHRKPPVSHSGAVGHIVFLRAA